MRKELDRALRLVATIAANQHGVISFEQLVGAGLSPATIHRRVRAGHLHRLHRGVYAVGHTSLSDKGRLMAAALACGAEAVISHESAAYLWSLSPYCPPYIHVTVPGHGGRSRRKGIVPHRSSTLRPEDVKRKHNIPVTSPERTRSDLGWDREPTRSQLERAFLKLVRRARLRSPRSTPASAATASISSGESSASSSSSTATRSTPHERRSNRIAAAIASSRLAATSS